MFWTTEMVAAAKEICSLFNGLLMEEIGRDVPQDDKVTDTESPGAQQMAEMHEVASGVGTKALTWVLSALTTRVVCRPSSDDGRVELDWAWALSIIQGTPV